jgi:hypothetical protein
MSNRLSGALTLAYQGTDAVQPPNIKIVNRAPLPTDTRNVVLGDIWFDKPAQEAYMLVSLARTMKSQGVLVATWTLITIPLIAFLVGNNGLRVAPNSSSLIYLKGDDISIATTGDNSTHTITLAADLSDVLVKLTGNTGSITPNSSGTMFIQGDGTTIQFTGSGNTLTAMALAPVPLTLTGNDGNKITYSLSDNFNIVGDGETVLVTGSPGSHTLTMSLIPSEYSLTLTGDNAVTVQPGAGNNISIIGGSGIYVTGTPINNTLTIGAHSNIATIFTTNSGSATPSGGILTIGGSSNITTSATGETVTIAADASLDVSSLSVANLTVTASADLSFTNAGIVQTNSSGAVSSTAGTNGQVLIGSSIGAPAWANITAGSNISIVNSSNGITISNLGAGSQAWNLIASGGNNPLIFNSGITSAYQTLVFVGTVTVATTSSSSTVVILQLSSNGGSSYYTSNYQSYVIAYARNSSAVYYSTTSTTSSLVGYLSDGALNEKGGFILYIYNIQGTSYVTTQSVGSYSTYAAFATGPYSTGGIYSGSLTGPINAIKLILGATGGINGSLYGLSY